MNVPFVSRNAIVFECHSGTLCVGDLVNPPARYSIDFSGILHLPASAIILAGAVPGSFSIDTAQIFLIDSLHYDAISKAVTSNGNMIPNHSMYASLRAESGTQFGYVVAGELFDTAFEGDGTFTLDLSGLSTGLPCSKEQPGSDAHELLWRTISSMNTLVCASCFSNEIMSHPELGMSPGGRGKQKSDWTKAMVAHAIESGWTALPEVGSFGEVTVLCPACKAQRDS